MTVFVGNSATGGFAYQTYKQTPAVLPLGHQKISGADRFKLVLDDGAVLDLETGLVWERDTDATTTPIPTTRGTSVSTVATSTPKLSRIVIMCAQFGPGSD